MTLVLIGVWAFFWRVEGRWFNTFFQQIHLALQDSEIQLLLEVHWLPSTPRCFFQSLESQLVVLLMQEIPNNHLGCIPKPQKIMGWSNKLNWWTQDFWSINSIFRKKVGDSDSWRFMTKFLWGRSLCWECSDLWLKARWFWSFLVPGQ